MCDNESLLREFEYLWDNEEPEYVLLGSTERLELNTVEKWTIFHLPTRSALLIEDPNISRLIKTRMLEKGVEIISPDSIDWDAPRPLDNSEEVWHPDEEGHD